MVRQLSPWTRLGDRMIVQIYGTSHRGLIAIIQASSIKTAMEQYFAEIGKKGDRKMIRGERMTVIHKNGVRTSYTAKKVK